MRENRTVGMEVKEEEKKKATQRVTEERNKKWKMEGSEAKMGMKNGRKDRAQKTRK